MRDEMLEKPHTRIRRKKWRALTVGPSVVFTTAARRVTGLRGQWSCSPKALAVSFESKKRNVT